MSVLWVKIWFDLWHNKTRTLLTVLGTVIGLGALVATLGLSLTAGSRIVGRCRGLRGLVVQRSVVATAGGAGTPDQGHRDGHCGDSSHCARPDHLRGRHGVSRLGER